MEHRDMQGGRGGMEAGPAAAAGLVARLAPALLGEGPALARALSADRRAFLQALALLQARPWLRACLLIGSRAVSETVGTRCLLHALHQGHSLNIPWRRWVLCLHLAAACARQVCHWWLAPSLARMLINKHRELAFACACWPGRCGGRGRGAPGDGAARARAAPAREAALRGARWRRAGAACRAGRGAAAGCRAGAAQGGACLHSCGAAWTGGPCLWLPCTWNCGSEAAVLWLRCKTCE